VRFLNGADLQICVARAVPSDLRVYRDPLPRGGTDFMTLGWEFTQSRGSIQTVLFCRDMILAQLPIAGNNDA
jgi:hypothetical protein